MKPDPVTIFLAFLLSIPVSLFTTAAGWFAITLYTLSPTHGFIALGVIVIINLISALVVACK